MMEAFYGVELILLLASAVIWGLAGLAANQAINALSQGNQVQVWRKCARFGIWAGTVLFFLWVADVLLLLVMVGWLFAIDRIIVFLPMMAVPLAFLFTKSIPVLRSGEMERKRLPAMLVPIQAMFSGTVLCLCMVLFDIPAIPQTNEIAAYWGVLVLFSMALWTYQKKRIEKIMSKPPSLAVRCVRGAGMLAALAVIVAGWFMWSLESSKLPPSMSMIDHALADFGGGEAFPLVPGHHGSHHAEQSGIQTISVSDLTGPQSGKPDKQFTLTAEKKQIQLSSGETVEAWTFNGQTPGPELVVNKGDLVEVTLVNKDIEQGVTLHWHGVDVPNGEDGVAGMTQNAVKPGESFRYRFIANETGSHWYHSHQLSSIQVKKGLFGAFIILPENQPADEQVLELSVFAHDWNTSNGIVSALDRSTAFRAVSAEPGTSVRLRLMNSSSDTKLFSLNGTPFQVAAVDGNDLHEPGMLTDHLLKIGGGGRYDVVFTMPETPVTLALRSGNREAGIVLSKDGQAAPEPLKKGTVLDLTRYGRPAPSPYGAETRYDRHFLMLLDQIYVGNYNGKTAQLWAINGEVFPNVPTFMVREGEKVKTTIVNRSFAPHPMHLHGHHIHVVSKNGKPLEGSPLVLDTLLIEPGETYEVAFTANNPGLWMDHCHNLEHAALGMTMHLAYQNVVSPYSIGGEHGNHPE